MAISSFIFNYMSEMSTSDLKLS